MLPGVTVTSATADAPSRRSESRLGHRLEHPDRTVEARTPVYRRFADWIGREILAERPDVEAVEVRTVRTHTTVPPQPPDPSEEPRHAITVRRTP